MQEIARDAGSFLQKWLPEAKTGANEVGKAIVKEVKTVLPMDSYRRLFRIAGISGALASVMGSYGEHVFRPSHKGEERTITFDVANRYHFLHSLALLAVPLTRNPQLVGSLLISGMVLFCGSCYVHALTGNKKIIWVTPIGGMLLTGAWIAMVL